MCLVDKLFCLDHDKLEMKKLLPKTANNQQGFTLIELMVAITIVAILSMMGLVAFTSVQKNARDSRRRGDIDAIAIALEANKNPNQAKYATVIETQFAAKLVPSDPLTPTRMYCAQLNATTPAAPPAPTTWAIKTACPTGAEWGGGGTVAEVKIGPTGAAFDTAVSWTVCAALEDTTIYCRFSAQ